MKHGPKTATNHNSAYVTLGPNGSCDRKATTWQRKSSWSCGVCCLGVGARFLEHVTVCQGLVLGVKNGSCPSEVVNICEQL